MSSGTYDYVIVGSGAGGSVLAGRLSADPDVSVLLVEAGGTDRAPIHLVPKGFYYTVANPRYAKDFQTEPYPDGSHEVWHRGRVIGGSTTINGMVWNRGWAADYDQWEQAGNKGWNWERFREAYREIESHSLGGTYFRGASGPVPIEIAGPSEPVCDLLIQSMDRNGVAFEDDMNGSDNDRVSYVASNTRNGLRVSASRAFLRRARRRRNLTIVPDTEAEHILFEGTRAVGVQARRRGEPVAFHARREVLVCGGAFDSPMLLERSGIGDPDVLAAAGVPLRVASPRVGENLREHRGILFQLRLDGVRGYNHLAANFVRQMWTGFKYLFTRDGLMAHGGFAVSGIYASDPSSSRPDTQSFFTPISTSAVNPMTGRLVVDKHPGARFVTFPLHPTSQGNIHITGPSPTDAPKLVPNFLSTEHDRALLLKVVRKAREILATPPISDHVVAELEPGPGISTDEQILDYALNKGNAGYHTLGTCAMGPDERDVVDDRLRVRGTTGLRVVDASVFPWEPSGNNNAPTMAMAWIAADLIRADHG
ncbi:GMC family oxidoreductase [Prauserella cavernicola]|uniref:GMC family oxidoreductase N-terminal domain-containing protein n=1 Tax=Prauserella cavernicola TaxID=2800127 RepID=A0A934QV60_9PSEU|nr:GMC family oxidoreductase N-terminal domain-containing protein [Prauserella cavernicola]MBK1787095.1 GMC family oxidoreductase N-terminal domain-containing protein [Prauserella cavernicola]